MSGCSKFVVFVLSRLVSIIHGVSFSVVKLACMFSYNGIILKDVRMVILEKNVTCIFFMYIDERLARALRARICSLVFIEVKIPILSYIIGESVSVRFARAYSSLLLIN